MPIVVGNTGGNREIKRRALVAGIIATLAMGALVGRLYKLQILDGQDYRAKSIGNAITETRIPSDRGTIFDAKGRVLVDSRPSYNVTLTPAICQAPDAPKRSCVETVIPQMALYLGLTPEEQERALNQYNKAKGLERYRDFVVKVDADLDALDRVEAHKLDLPGVEVVTAPRRNYRYGAMASHLLGYMNEITQPELEQQKPDQVNRYQLGDYIGRRGVERKFDQVLHGTDGVKRMVVDAKGRRIPNAEYLIPPDKQLTLPHAGNDLVLSLDVDLQKAAEKAFTADAGVLAVIEVKTGFILALVSKPGYDPNTIKTEMKSLSDNPYKPLIFRAVQEHYHPGSTFKIVTALAALGGGTATRSTTVGCSGGYTLGNRRWRCHIDRGHGIVNMHHALQWSCDTYFYAMADRMGLEPIADMAKKLGFGSSAGLGLSPEVPGIVPSVAYYNKVSPSGYTKGVALNAAIGQGDVNVTPLQLVLAYAAIANGGTVYKPQIVRKIVNPDGTVQEMAPQILDTLSLAPKDLALVREGLLAVVNEPGGTAFRQRIPEVKVAGKTGTAQVVDNPKNGRFNNGNLSYWKRDHAWFAGYAPADDPEIAIVVLAEHMGHGGVVSAPFGMEVFRAYMKLYHSTEPGSPEVTSAARADHPWN